MISDYLTTAILDIMIVQTVIFLNRLISSRIRLSFFKSLYKNDIFLDAKTTERINIELNTTVINRDVYLTIHSRFGNEFNYNGKSYRVVFPSLSMKSILYGIFKVKMILLFKMETRTIRLIDMPYIDIFEITPFK